MTNIFTEVWDWIEGEGQVVITDVETAYAGVSLKVQSVLGDALQVDQTVVAAFSQPLAAAIAAGITALEAMNTDVGSAITASGTAVATAAKSVSALSAAADTLATQVSPFIKSVGNDASAVDAALVATIAALTGVTAPAATTTPAAAT